MENLPAPPQIYINLYNCTAAYPRALNGARPSNTTILSCWQCHKYGQYLGQPSKAESECIFWILFIIDLVLVGQQSLLWARQVSKAK